MIKIFAFIASVVFLILSYNCLCMLIMTIWISIHPDEDTWAHRKMKEIFEENNFTDGDCRNFWDNVEFSMIFYSISFLVCTWCWHYFLMMFQNN